MTRRNLLAVLAVLTLAPFAACTKDTRPRCAECGMYADVAPAWATEARTASGELLHFDTPKCLFLHGLRDGAPRLASRRVTEHYTQTLVPAESVAYVIGTDLVGPMGKDLVPVAREHVEGFVRDHGGRVVEPSAIDRALLGTLSP